MITLHSQDNSEPMSCILPNNSTGLCRENVDWLLSDWCPSKTMSHAKLCKPYDTQIVECCKDLN